MKKVFAFIGSPRKEKSNTYILTKMMLDKLVEMDKNIEYEILTAGHIKLNFCQGCLICATKGICPEDEHDDVGMIKEKMIAADLIILGSPMYGGGISGQLKTLLDRIALLYLQKRLAGRPGVTVATTGMSPNESMHEFLAGPMMELGLKVIARLDATTSRGEMDDPETRKRAEKVAETVFPYLTGEKLIESDETTEMAFQGMKSEMPLFKKECPAVYKYWKESGMLEVNSYAELLEKIRKEAVLR
ncbi:MAG: NAD(P)H-dependent oxidoreductase [Candidatus Eremiobacteraeota bacterium]|nr:NAD(P)H-dependent oxidoreductase [Candidatus Eremiobacteraeota bacterium]